MVYCPVCGTENPEDVEECKNCNANLENILNNIKSEEREYNLLKMDLDERYSKWEELIIL